MDGTDTDRKFRWTCKGINAENRWSCLGLDGANNWQCSYKSQSKSCSMVESADDRSCREITGYATDASCFTCKPCTGDNEELNSSTCDCVCEAGYRKVGGICMRLPVCGVTEPNCDSGEGSNSVDTLNPATNRWICTGAGQTLDCDDEAPPPTCGGNQTYALDSASELTCVCEAGYREIGGVCMRLPVCGETEPNCRIGEDASSADTLNPATNRWTCTSAGQTIPCDDEAPPPTCKANETYGLNSSNELVCVCKEGYESYNEACREVHTLTVIVNQLQPNAEGRVTGSGIDCPGTCSVGVVETKEVSLSASANAGYSCKFESSDENTTGFEMKQDTTETANCDTTLKADAGGHYTAEYVDLSGIGGIGFYLATVTATATGGVPQYKYTWDGFTEQTSSTAYYIFATPDTYEKWVTVRDADGVTDQDKATIAAGTGTTQSGGAADFSFEVPLGGDRYLVWGEDSFVTASSGDTAVVGVSVDSPVIRLTGVGAGTTDLILQTDAGELRLPVEVK